MDGGGTKAANCSAGYCSGLPASFAAAGGWSCGISVNQKLYCWGDNYFGQLGVGTLTNNPAGQFPAPVLLPAGLNPAQVAAGSSVTYGTGHVCAVLEDRSTNPVTNAGLACWGSNDFGQLGTGIFGSGTEGETRVSTPVRVLNGGTGGSAVAAVATGGAHTCVLMGNGAVACFGRNDKGQLGNTTLQDQPSAVWASGLSSGGAAAIAAGQSHSCAVTNLGAVLCWGDHDKYQLGFSLPFGTTRQSYPGQVNGLTANVVSVVAGDKHSCALKNTGEVYCWGDNSKGQLGSGFFGQPSDMPTAVPNLSEVVSITAGGKHTCALKASGQAYCWGSNDFGELGTNSTVGSGILEPQLVVNLPGGALAIEAGVNHTCLLKTEGMIACFGGNPLRELGFDGPAKQPENAAMPNPGLDPQIPAPQYFNCPALRTFSFYLNP